MEPISNIEIWNQNIYPLILILLFVNSYTFVVLLFFRVFFFPIIFLDGKNTFSLLVLFNNIKMPPKKKKKKWKIKKMQGISFGPYTLYWPQEFVDAPTWVNTKETFCPLPVQHEPLSSTLHITVFLLQLLPSLHNEGLCLRCWQNYDSLSHRLLPLPLCSSLPLPLNYTVYFLRGPSL